MPAKKTARQRRYPYRGTVRMVRRVVNPPREIEGRMFNGGISMVDAGTRPVRYAIEWDQDRLAELVQAAAGNKSGKSTAGPITVYIHPEDQGSKKA